MEQQQTESRQTPDQTYSVVCPYRICLVLLQVPAQGLHDRNYRYTYYVGSQFVLRAIHGDEICICKTRYHSQAVFLTDLNAAHAGSIHHQTLTFESIVRHSTEPNHYFSE